MVQRTPWKGDKAARIASAKSVGTNLLLSHRHTTCICSASEGRRAWQADLALEGPKQGPDPTCLTSAKSSDRQSQINAGTSMWRLVSQSDSGRHPHLRSLNEHTGRQTWEWDPDAGTQEERDNVEQLRAAFSASKDTQKHSSDELLRLQVFLDRISIPLSALRRQGPLSAMLDRSSSSSSVSCHKHEASTCSLQH